MKNRLFTFLCIFCMSAAGVSAQVRQDAVSSMISRMENSRLSFDYEYVADIDKVPVRGSGHLVVQDAAWLLEGDGLKVWFDGKERWTVDIEAKEVVVETVSAGDGAVMPVVMITELPELFDWSMISESRYELHPKDGTETDFTSAVLVFDKSSALSGAELYTKKGGKISFVFSALEFATESSLAPIAISESSFDSSYFITDMR